jgi:hypothetical protein
MSNLDSKDRHSEWLDSMSHAFESYNDFATYLAARNVDICVRC